MKIVVVGGTGLVGSKVVAELRERGREAVAASPDTGVNAYTGAGLQQALTGSDVVVDVSNSPSFEPAAVLDFFETSTRNMLAVEEAKGVRHHVALSVVGTDRLLESGYFRAKIAQENLIKSGPIPWTIVRATQFFEFLKSIADAATTGNTVRLPPAYIQPIAAEDVAAIVARVAVAEPLNGVLESAGPERFLLDEFFRLRFAEKGERREVATDSGARYFGAELSETTLLPDTGAQLGATRFEEWSHQVAPR